MFDQKPEGIEDIFAETEKAGMPVVPGAGSPPPPLPSLESGGGRGKIVWVALGGIVLLVLVGGGLYLAFRGGGETASLPAPSAQTAASEPSPEIMAPTEPSLQTSTPSFAPTPSPAPSESVTDTDRDGLSDNDEALAGTNPLIVDTDSDQLSDVDEIRTYKTNPLVPDTDKDGYLDGAEVKAGYNPNGPGKLK